MGIDPSTNRIDTAFANRPPGLWPFIAAGYPNLEITAALLQRLNTLPIRGVELGIPFSDPIADGPVIQQAFTRALASGIKVQDVFEMVASVRAQIAYPLLAMVSASIVYRRGVEVFAAEAHMAGFDGLIVPDISLEEAPALALAAAKENLRLSMLVAPTTPPERRRRIAQAATGFLYYVSVQGTTGERAALPAALADEVRSLKAESSLPVLVGFGISRPDHVREVCRFADGAIVGSAIVHRMATSAQPIGRTADLIDDVARFVGDLAGE
ncbi:MAG TPA: tryptophan synthase subunit alpha [Phycisphaerae bacterium]|nr:tryptophan synthase subunit alpha [Phycisphaerae bacterium]